MQHTTLQRSLLLLGATALTLGLSACGNATETGLEELIESQGGGNVDLDLDGDGGGFSMQTEEGGMSIDEDGNFVITDADGSVVTGEVDSETGEVNVQSEDGSFSSGATTELPEEWPADVPQPSGMAITSATVIGSEGDLTISINGTTDGDGFVDAYASELEGAGFNEDSSFTSEGTINNTYSNDQWAVNVGVFNDDVENQVLISIFRQS